MIRILFFIFLFSGCPSSGYAAETYVEKETIVEEIIVPDYIEYAFYQTDFLSPELLVKRPLKFTDFSIAGFCFQSSRTTVLSSNYFRSSQNIIPGLESRDIAYPFHFFL